MYAGKVRARVRAPLPAVASVRPNAFPLADGAAEPQVTALPAGETPGLTFVRFEPTASGGGLGGSVGVGFGLVPLGVDTTASHTTLITILAETGLVGLTIVLVAGFSFARSAVRARILGPVERTLALAPVIGLLVILLASQFSSRLFEEPYLWLFLGLAYSAQAGLDDGGESREPTELGVTS